MTRTRLFAAITRPAVAATAGAAPAASGPATVRGTVPPAARSLDPPSNPSTTSGDGGGSVRYGGLVGSPVLPLYTGAARLSIGVAAQPTTTRIGNTRDRTQTCCAIRTSPGNAADAT